MYATINSCFNLTQCNYMLQANLLLVRRGRKIYPIKTLSLICVPSSKNTTDIVPRNVVRTLLFKAVLAGS